MLSTLRAWERASLAQWFCYEAERVYGALAETDSEREQRILADLLGRLGGTATRAGPDAGQPTLHHGGGRGGGAAHWPRQAGAIGSLPRLNRRAGGRPVFSDLLTPMTLTQPLQTPQKTALCQRHQHRIAERAGVAPPILRRSTDCWTKEGMERRNPMIRPQGLRPVALPAGWSIFWTSPSGPLRGISGGCAGRENGQGRTAKGRGGSRVGKNRIRVLAKTESKG